MTWLGSRKRNPFTVSCLTEELGMSGNRRLQREVAKKDQGSREV